MERHARDIIGGSYSPSFFTIRIPNCENYEHLFVGDRLSEQAEAYFLHEYIHFLQDLTTIPGLSNICIVVDYIKWATHQVKNGVIGVPVVPTDADGFNLLNNRSMNEARLGQGELKGVKVAEITHLELNETVVDLNGDNHTHLNAIVTFNDGTGQERKYKLGEYALSESMAYAIEQIIYPKVLPDGSDCPYSIVRLVCDKFLPGLSDDPCTIVALCDGCLMYSLPGRIFAMAIEQLKTRDYQKLTPEQLFDFIVNNQELQETEHNIIPRVSFNDHLERYSLLAAEQLGGYFTTSNYEKEKLFSYLMLYDAMEIRKKHPHFLINIARGGKIRENDPLKATLGELGCPVVLNNTEDLISIFGRISYLLKDDNFYDPSCFWVFNQMYKLFKQGALHNDTFKCEMIDWCKMCFKMKNVKDLTEEGDSCLYSPWLRTSDDEFQLCSFGRFWRTIGLAGVEPVSA